MIYTQTLAVEILFRIFTAGHINLTIEGKGAFVHLSVFSKTCILKIQLTDTWMQLDKILLGLGLAKNVTELLTLFLVILLVSTVFWLLIGRFRLHNFLINIYISFAILQVLPKNLMTFNSNAYLLVFIILLAVLTFMNKYLFDIHQSGSGLAIWQVFVMSFFEVVLILSIIFSYLPVKSIQAYISKDALAYFTDPWWRVAWMVIPLVFLIFIKKRDK